ncbi:MAG: alpha-amylase family protein [Bacteroidota bacterium]
MQETSKPTKPVIYQLFVRLFGNKKNNNVLHGDIKENGCGKFNDINDEVLKSIKELGVTHIWLTGIIEHATCTDYSKYGLQKDNPAVIKGRAGSPYAIRNYYQLDPDLAENVNKRMSEFEALIKRFHNNDLKLIIDFVPNHVARQYATDHMPEGIEALGVKDDKTKAFDPQNNFYYLPGEKLIIPEEVKNLPYVDASDIEAYTENPAIVTGNDCFSNSPSYDDWYETIKINYGVDYKNNRECHFKPIPYTWHKMTNILFFWLEKGVDGFRCDMAEMVPVEFWNYAISQIKNKFPDSLFIGEIYNPDAYKSYIDTGKFDLLYDKEGLYNTLRGVIEGKLSARMLSLCWQSLDGIDANMLRFLENHDEQRIASKQFADDPWRGIPGMVLSTSFNKGAVMIYFGQELGEAATEASGFSGEDGRTSIFDYCTVPSVFNWLYNKSKLTEESKNLRKAYAEIMQLSKRPEIFDGNFYDLMWVNNDSDDFYGNYIYTYIRYLDEKAILFVINFSKDQALRTRIKIPADFLELMNLDNYFDLYGKDIFPSGKMFTCNKNELINNGIVIIAEPNTAYAFELEFLK